jgi:DNA repair protein RecO (recombination protein O)
MPIYKTQALALRLLPFEETSGLVTLLTRERGKAKAVAKSIRRPHSSLAAAVQPGSYSFVSIAPGRNLDLLTQASVLESFPGLRRDLLHLAHAIHVLELLDLTTALGQADEELFDLAVHVMSALEGAPQPGAVLAVLHAHVLHSHGVDMVLDRCAGCGGPIKVQPGKFSVSRGGRVCADCARSAPDGFGLTPSLLSELIRLQSTVGSTPHSWPASVGPEAARVLERFLVYHLGVEPRSGRFLQTVVSASNKRS